MQRQDIIDALQRINASPKLGVGDFVGAMYDDSSPPGSQLVALVVGINYGQQATSARSVGRTSERLGYAKHIKTITKHDCHTVLWNFFPYLTEFEWGDDISNSADEAERLFDKGYADPLAIFAALYAAVAPDFIVFHGVSCAVPILARVVMQSINCKCFLTRNLSRGVHEGSLKQIQ